MADGGGLFCHQWGVVWSCHVVVIVAVCSGGGGGGLNGGCEWLLVVEVTEWMWVVVAVDGG